ncbi:MAG: IS66 family transposase [Pyrinomonadaceae bacterium]
MEKEPLASPIADISAQDWQHIPESVQRFIFSLLERLSTVEHRLAAVEEENRLLKQQNQLLKERLASNSSNSSRPPSSDATTQSRQNKESTGRKRGAQPGHTAHHRQLIPVEQCQKVVDHYPKQCRGCGSALRGTDSEPLRHQVVEIPPVTPYVEEHRLHRLCCLQCGVCTCAPWPEGVPTTGYGPRLVAIVAVLSGLYRLSERMAQEAISDLFGVEICVGSIDRLRQEASLAVAAPVEQARLFVQQQEVVHADETGFVQGNADGANPDKRKAWLWVAATISVIAFRLSLSRGADAARQMLGEMLTAVLISDRWHAYNWIDLRQRQLCWAHLKREFQKIAERGGESRRIGEALLAEEKKLLAYFNRVRDGTLARSTFRVYAGAIRQRITALLEEGAGYRLKRGDKSERARTARTCRELLKVERAMWLFVRREGVEPTNNAAERAIRPAVLWRRTSFGAQSAEGSEFVARMLTVVMSLRAQQRNVLEYMVEACQAARRNATAPSLLPQVSAP